MINIDVLARLARLHLSDAEHEQFQKDIESIIGHIDQLQQINTEGVEPTFHGVKLEAVLRDDTTQESLPLNKVFANAPERLGDGFGVPKIIG